LDIALKLSKLCLAGQGDIGHRLNSITKYQLTHVQYPLDDFQYQINNLAVDMRDGIRLTRLIEIFARRDDLAPQLRWPAQGATQRIHNLSIALSAIQTEGVDLRCKDGESITANDIEAGSREKTLSVLWCLISRWRLPQYLKNIDLKAEIRFLEGILSIRKETLPPKQVSSVFEI
jgi:abnormal spindle-like microcephaly-associated protein